VILEAIHNLDRTKVSIMSRFKPYQTGILFLLVGANPLPNYVAALLLARDGGKVYLLHTVATIQIASRLRRKISERRPSLEIILHEIDEADSRKIDARIAKIISDIKPGKTVGLNYTGGTKPMAVQAYHTLRESFPDGYFSYLDARTLKMYINRGSGQTQTPLVGQSVELSLEELLALHGYKLKHSPPRQVVRQAELCWTIAQVHGTPEGFKQWRDWTLTLGTSPILPALADYPALAAAIQGFANLCGGRMPTETEVTRALGFEDLKSCSKFFIGDWLEEYTLDAITQIAGALGIKYRGISLKTRRKKDQPEFELDVAAMHGYQLFAISCIATEEMTDKKDATKPGKAKEHLFEVFARARQVGGDEARFGLVSCVKNPLALQREIEREWDAQGKIRVFGQRDLLSLADGLRDWFETANKEAL
jgi:hypothetical protein